MILDYQQLPVVSLHFWPGDPSRSARWVARFRDRTVIPCEDFFCCGGFSQEFVPGRKYPVRLEPRARPRDNRLSEFYVAHRYVVPAPVLPSPFESQFRGPDVSLGNRGLRLTFLGGIGSAGSASCAVLSFEDTSIMVDCGVNVAKLEPDTNPEEFAEDSSQPSPFPNFQGLISRPERVKVVFLTHGHLDHFGGLAEYLGLPDCPLPRMIGHRITTALASQHLAECGLAATLPSIEEIKEDDHLEIGPFKVRAFPVCHSVPGSLGFAISLSDTEDEGSIVFTGDMKTRNNSPWDILATQETFQNLQPIRLLVMDCTNATVEGYTGLESSVDEDLIDIIASARGRIFVTLFATHLSRIERLARLSGKLGKKLGIAGASVKKTLAAADAAGLTLQFQTENLSEAGVIIIPGCQANDNSAAWRLSQGVGLNDLKIEVGDTVVFSANPIPGRRTPVTQMAYGFRRQGARVILDENYPEIMYNFERQTVHASGHGFEKDIETVIEAAQPTHFLPYHCGRKAQVAAAEIASRCSIADGNIILLESNGTNLYL